MSQPTPSIDRAPEAHLIYQRVGELTRRLHESLRELGHDKRLQTTLGSVPDARARLSFIARLTGEAAEKVLDTVDAAQARQEALAAEAIRVVADLDADGADSRPGSVLRRFAASVQAGARDTSADLTSIMMAQDFHDLTGQTVSKVIEVANSLEEALVALLVEAAPPDPPAARGPMDGPVATTEGRTDVVADQAQVDDLLESLGF